MPSDVRSRRGSRADRTWHQACRELPDARAWQSKERFGMRAPQHQESFR